MTAARQGTKERFSNVGVVTIAVYLLGGQSRPVDTEDVAIKANQLAPGRYSWRKFKDQINIELVRTFLSDAKKPKNGRYLSGSGNEGWMLTETGLDFAKGSVSRAQATNLATKRLSEPDKKWLRRERGRILASDAFLKAQESGVDAVTASEAEKLFRIDSYVQQGSRERKITRLVNAFRDDLDIGPIVKALAHLARTENVNER